MSIPIELLRSVRQIITHKNCPDGYASAMLLRHALPHATVTFLQYNTPEMDQLEAEPGMLFCDITPPRERAMEFAEAGAIVLDHHKGQRDIVMAFGERGVYADEELEPGVSGAMLAWREVWWLLRGGRPDDDESRRAKEFAELAGIRDTWQKDSPRWYRACAQATALMFLGEDRLMDEDVPNEPYLGGVEVDMGEMLLDTKLAAARRIAETGLFALGGWRFFNDGGTSHIISDVAEAARELDPDAIGIVGFYYTVTSDGLQRLVFSMRSGQSGLDVAAIAKANKGGGHTHAAGFSVEVCLESFPPIVEFQRALRKAGM